MKQKGRLKKRIMHVKANGEIRVRSTVHGIGLRPWVAGFWYCTIRGTRVMGTRHPDVLC